MSRKARRWNNATAAHAARPKKLRDGTWGAVVNGFVRDGDPLLVETRAGKQWFATAAKIVYRDDKITIVATEKEKSETQKRKAHQFRASLIALSSALRIVAISMYATTKGEKEGKKAYRRDALIFGDREKLLIALEDRLDDAGDDDAADLVADAREAYKRGDASQVRRLLLEAAADASDVDLLERAAGRF